jgi:hypothetical protein
MGSYAGDGATQRRQLELEGADVVDDVSGQLIQVLCKRPESGVVEALLELRDPCCKGGQDHRRIVGRPVP